MSKRKWRSIALKMINETAGSGGGGSEPIYVTVSFYNGDELLDTQTLKEGDKIIPPASPTKESTAQYSYTFKGWSLDGETLAEVGTAGTSNLTYYALFEETLRHYTVRFLNSDGTVLQTTSVAYGETPVYAGSTPIDPNGEGDFDGWIPDIVAVTGEADYTAKYIVPPAFAYTLNSDNASYSVSGIGTVTDTDIVIPSYYKGLPVTAILREAFVDTNITSVIIPNSVTSIGTSAFKNCSSLTGVYITEIEAWFNISFANHLANPLYYAKNLYLNNELVTELTIPDGVLSIGKYAFQSCESLTSVVIGDGVTSIGENAFNACKSLMEVAISNTVVTINDQAFYDCTNLTSVVIPDSVTTIGTAAFAMCSNLTSVIIGERVTSIKQTSFYECENLKNITLLPTTPPTLDGLVFNSNVTGRKFIVPIGTLVAYQSATNWSDYASQMEETTE